MVHSHKTLVIYIVHGNTVKSTQTVITYSDKIVPIDPVQQYIHSCVRDGGASEQLGGEPKMQNTLEGVWGMLSQEDFQICMRLNLEASETKYFHQ